MSRIRYYVVYDGRAADGDSSKASVLESLGEQLNPRAAFKEACKHWSDQEACLYSYKIIHDELTDEIFEGIVP